MNLIAVSTYSLREQLGPIVIPYTDEDGAPQTFRQDFASAIDIADVPAIAGACGAGGVELVAFQIDGIDDPAIDRFAEGAHSAGVQLVNAAVDVGDLLSTDPLTRQADVTELSRWITRLARAGFSHVRVNAGSPFSRPSDPIPPDHLVTALVQLGEHANAQGARLLIENHGGPSSDPQWMATLLESVGRDRLGLLLDLGNFDALLGPLMGALSDPAADEAPDPFAVVDLEPVYAGIDALAPHAELVHVKAHHVGDDGAAGPVDLPRALQIVRAHGYDGPLTIEYEGRGGDPREKIRIIRELIEKEGR